MRNKIRNRASGNTSPASGNLGPDMSGLGWVGFGVSRFKVYGFGAEGFWV